MAEINARENQVDLKGPRVVQPSLGFGSAPDVPAEAREELLALKSGAMFVCTRPDGDIRPGRASGEGLYAHDTRHLSELRLTVGESPPVMLSSVIGSGHDAVINATNPRLRSATGESVPQEKLNIRRTLLIADRLFYQVCVRSFCAEPVATVIAISLAADFADVFEARGVERRTSGEVLAPVQEDATLRFGYLAGDGHRRETRVELSPPATQIRIESLRAQISWDVTLGLGQAHTVTVTVLPDDAVRFCRELDIEQAAAELDSGHTGWLTRCAPVVTDNGLFDRLVEASVRDLHALMMPLGDDRLPAAGIPWYVAPFGRDSLVTACESLMINPEIARGTLLALAGLQANADEPWRDAEPGKIPHELRTGELSRAGQIPHTPYYGTADGTPLFLMVAGDYYRWTHDLETMTRLLPAFDAALAWIDHWGDRDGDGFVEYERRAPGGLVNQGWKDSHDAIVHSDGSLAQGAIALVEIQGYVYAAKLGIADVYEALGDTERAGALRTEAGALRVAFNCEFWNPDESFFALALDGRKNQVRSVTSNPAHCLYCGIVDEDKAAIVAERLMAPDMFSGWGIRTLSDSSLAYNPMSYHNGSVWPHDNAIAAAGLKRYGFDAATNAVAAGMFDAAAGAPDFRLPELFCGFQRNGSRAVVAYPVACIPQAWAAASPFMLLQAMLGISAHAADDRLMVDRPRLPAWLSNVEIRRIRVGQSNVSLGFQQAGPITAFSLLEQHGDVRVTMST